MDGSGTVTKDIRRAQRRAGRDRRLCRRWQGDCSSCRAGAFQRRRSRCAREGSRSCCVAQENVRKIVSCRFWDTKLQPEPGRISGRRRGHRTPKHHLFTPVVGQGRRQAIDVDQSIVVNKTTKLGLFLQQTDRLG